MEALLYISFINTAIIHIYININNRLLIITSTNGIDFGSICIIKQVRSTRFLICGYLMCLGDYFVVERCFVRDWHLLGLFQSMLYCCAGYLELGLFVS